MSGENSTNTEQRYQHKQLLILYNNFGDILFHFLGREKPLIIFCTGQF